MKILLVGNGETYNHGCEAIALTTISLLRSVWPDSDVCIFSFGVQADKAYEQRFNRVTVYPVLQEERSGFIPRVLRKLGVLDRKERTLREKLSRYLEELNDADLVLSLGGDNYSDDYALPVLFWELGVLARERNVPFVIWGASVGPFTKPGSMDLAKRGLDAVSLVTARENATVDYLASLGYADKVIRVYDSAFVLDKTPIELPAFKRDAEIVGFNISPIYYKYTNLSQEQVLEIATKFVNQISQTYNVLLIPHVVYPNSNNNDFAYMSKIASGENVKILDKELNCMQIKFAISKCNYFVGARTHATIAAFSQNIPTLSLAYSLKADGINNDLFDSDEFLLRAEHFGYENLMQKFDSLVATKDTSINSLQSKSQIASAMVSKGLDAISQLVAAR